MTKITPTVYTQVTHDVASEKTQDARFIGLLDPGRTTLNIQTAFNKTDDANDTYRFTMMKTGAMGISATASKPADAKINIQVLNKGGKVIADSTAKSGALKDAWNQINATTYQAKKGDYYVRFTRGDGVAKNAVVQYTAQIRNGFTVTRDDYTTVEKAAAAGTIYASAASLSNVAAASQIQSSVGSLLDSSNFFSKIQSFTYTDVSSS